MIKRLFFLIFFCYSLFSNADLPQNYNSIIEKLIFFKDDNFKIFYGGPIDNGYGASWMMPVIFENDNHKPRAVYEISFINCAPFDKDLKNTNVFYIKASDIDIKFKNILSKEFLEFDKLINNKNKAFKAIVIRETDVSNVYYPEIFISSIYSDFRCKDIEKIYDFLKSKFFLRSKTKCLTKASEKPRIRNIQICQGLIEQKKIAAIINGKV